MQMQQPEGSASRTQVMLPRLYPEHDHQSDVKMNVSARQGGDLLHIMYDGVHMDKVARVDGDIRENKFARSSRWDWGLDSDGPCMPWACRP